MKTVVFYSYKGGTGRTLALANVAAFAAGIGQRVVVLDMDFEAPGATYKLLPDPSAAIRCRGLVGWLLDRINAGESPATIGDYLLEVPVRELVAGSGTGAGGGGLWLIPAGNIPSPNYFAELRRLAFDARAADGSALGLIRDLTAQLRAELRPDLLMIDARTGITNSNTLALSELADEVYVLLLDLPEQLDGTRMVLRSLTPLASAERPLTRTALLSRVPTDHEHRDAGWVRSEPDRERLERVREFLCEPASPLTFTVEEIDLLVLHHEPRLLAGEDLLLLRLDKDGAAEAALSWDYARLARRIVAGEAAIAAATAPLLRSTEPRDRAVAAVFHDAAELRAIPRPSRSADLESGSGDALTLAERIESLRAAAARDPARRGDLAAALLDLARAEGEIGRPKDAVHAATEANSLYRTLTASNQDYLPDLAMSLNNLSNRLSDAGRNPEALTAIAEAVTHYRSLAEALPERYLPDLAGSLNNLSNRLSDAGRNPEALTAIEEAVTHYRTLAEALPERYLPDLATSLNNLSLRLSDASRKPEALTAIEEAVAAYRAISAENPAFLTRLKAALRDYADVLRALERHDDAGRIEREANADARSLRA